MKTRLTLRTASFAIAMSLAGTAYAQDNGEDITIAGDDVAAENGSNAVKGSNKKNKSQDEGSNEPLAESTMLRTVTSTKQSGNQGKSAWGDIVAFDVSKSTLDPRYRNINPFYRDINAFWGTIHPFYGNINAFWGNINPFYGDIRAFWGDIDAFWGNIRPFEDGGLEQLGKFWHEASAQIEVTENHWASLQYTATLGQVTLVYDGTPNRILNSLETLIAQAEAQFGASYTAATGKSFRDGFVAEILARHGIDLNNKLSLAMTSPERAAFFLDWHDSLNQYSGIDAVDHWMSSVNWNPALTQIQGGGHQTVIGIIDGSFTADAALNGNIAWSGGGTSTVDGHGAAVASLIAAPHDGSGVMGIAPEVSIATYNPFNEDHTATWDSVADGIQSLLYAYVGGNDTGYVSIINLSLGESGYALSQGLADVFARPNISAWSHETIYVLASGNDGITQASDVNWDFQRDTSFILVGSVDPTGEISAFSNRPGNACLLDNGVCYEGNELYMRTVVAPGALILASDGNGGVTRVSGTSFAAPLVSGAVSLLHDRWPWLARHTPETAEIIFRSAQDLGEPGPDPVYGWGLLDVTASQSPLDFNNMTFTMYQRRGMGFKSWNVTASSLLSQGGIPFWWETDGVYLTGFENIGNTYRDFSIPMSRLSRGKSSTVLGHGSQRLQDFVGDRFANWILSGGADTDGDGVAGITQLRSNVAQTSGEWTMRYDAVAPRFIQDGAVRPVHNAATLISPGGTLSLTVGQGQGALALAGGEFGMPADSDPASGGVNPVLGLASGEFFAGANFKPLDGTTVSFGYSTERFDWEDQDFESDLDREIQRQLGAREAEAFTVGLQQKVTDAVTVDLQWTHLREDDALLGAQTGNAFLLGEGSNTDAVTVSANVDLGDGLSFDLTATGGATETADQQLLNTNGSAFSTAAQVALNKRGLINSRDVLRLSVGQPLNVESGQLELRSNQVVDRQTGEIGVTSQLIGISTERRYLGEVVYATPITNNSELGLIGRYVSAGGQGEEESFVVGANFGLRF